MRVHNVVRSQCHPAVVQGQEGDRLRLRRYRLPTLPVGERGLAGKGCIGRVEVEATGIDNGCTKEPVLAPAKTAELAITVAGG